MRRSIFIAFLLMSLSSYGQMIRGKVVIFEKDEPLENASVYYDGAYKGAVTDESGNFQLLPAASDQIPIIVSAIGYYSTSITNYKPGEFITVHLQPRTYSLDAVIFTDDGMSRAEKEAIFIREFIGVSGNSKDCEILNIDDVRLVYNKKRKSVEAFSDVPIIFHNKALGFKITYHLVGFNYSPGRIFFAGNYFFESDSTLSSDELDTVKQRRREAYWGSRMHFVRTLHKGGLESEGFVVLNAANHSRISERRLVTEIDGKKHINIPPKAAVVYKGQFNNGTYLHRKKRLTYMDRSGFYDPQALTWSGAMANQRMADLLPFEYDPASD